MRAGQNGRVELRWSSRGDQLGQIWFIGVAVSLPDEQQAIKLFNTKVNEHYRDSGLSTTLERALSCVQQ